VRIEFRRAPAELAIAKLDHDPAAAAIVRGVSRGATNGERMVCHTSGVAREATGDERRGVPSPLVACGATRTARTGGPKAARIGVAKGETYPRIIRKQSEQ
jgi:hypothetical protein